MIQSTDHSVHCMYYTSEYEKNFTDSTWIYSYCNIKIVYHWFSQKVDASRLLHVKYILTLVTFMWCCEVINIYIYIFLLKKKRKKNPDSGKPPKARQLSLRIFGVVAYGRFDCICLCPVLCCLAIAKRSVKNQVNSVEQW